MLLSLIIFIRTLLVIFPILVVLFIFSSSRQNKYMTSNDEYRKWGARTDLFFGLMVIIIIILLIYLYSITMFTPVI